MGSKRSHCPCTRICSPKIWVVGLVEVDDAKNWEPKRPLDTGMRWAQKEVIAHAYQIGAPFGWLHKHHMKSLGTLLPSLAAVQTLDCPPLPLCALPTPHYPKGQDASLSQRSNDHLPQQLGCTWQRPQNISQRGMVLGSMETSEAHTTTCPNAKRFLGRGQSPNVYSKPAKAAVYGPRRRVEAKNSSGSMRH